MANRYKNLIYSTAEYTHTYGDFKGVELNAGSLVNSKSRLAYSENMYKDYDGDGAEVIESVPGFRTFAYYDGTVYAIYYQRAVSGGEDHLIVHVGNKLMRHPVSDINRKDCVGTEIATLAEKKSFGFEYGRYFYVMDTESILRIDERGECKRIGDEGAMPYVPTTYISDEAYEQRNLLCDDFKEERYVADPSLYLYSTDGLKFTVVDSYLKYCSVSGIDSGVSGEIHLPAYVKIADAEYKVISVGDYAFYDNQKITAVWVAHGISEIGKRAFMNCDSLKSVVLSPTVTRIGSYAFASCSSLTSFYLGAGVSTVEDGVFSTTTALTSVNYALTGYELERIEGYSNLGSRSVVYNSTNEKIRLAITAHEDIKSVKEVTADGAPISFEPLTKDGKVIGATVEFNSITDATGVKLVMSGTLGELPNGWAADMTVLEVASPKEAILKCTRAEVFDGRIFFSGNPNFPNTVFYSERPKPGGDGEVSVGRYNYFNDGVGSYKVVGMLAVRDMLAVFKEGDDGSGSIFYHKKEATAGGAIDTIYPVAYVHSGICATGACLSFFDDPVFLSSEGLMALDSQNINYQRNVVCRSHNVNYALLKADLSKASLCEWLGYLVVGTGDTVLLADSRALFRHPTGAYEYEWFVIKGVGTHMGGYPVYRYAAEGYENLLAHPTLVGESVSYVKVKSVGIGGKMYYYVKEGEVSYRVERTEEETGGNLHPATVYISHGKRLFFATSDGHLCVFNNDMRGVAPDSIRKSAGFDEEEYAAAMGNRIHPAYYTFDKHAPRYVIKTAHDNCGVPHLTKSSVKKSLVIKAKSYLPDAITCEVTTDSSEPVYVGSFPAATVGFDDFDFTRVPWYVSRYATVALSEKEKRWVEKQITLTAEKYASPIAVYSISYRYVIKGKIKNNR